MHPEWLLRLVESDGASILNQGLGTKRIQKKYGLSEFKARALLNYLKARNPEGTVTTPNTLRPGPRTHLVIGDAHAKPGQSLDRFVWLGRMCAELRPDVIVSIGDWADMHSLSSYDKGKKAFEGRRYVADIEAANEALRLFHAQLPLCYKPELVQVTGNHEQRIERATNDASEFDGLISLNDLDFGRLGWKVAPFLKGIEIDGILYSHYFQAGNTSNAISGEYAASNLVRRQLHSCVAGHSHLLDYARRTDARGRPVSGLIVGCYTDAFESYAGPSNAIWWRGICVLRNVNHGDYDLETWNIGRIQSRWGKAQ
jgi:hypothetical protein